MRLVCEVGAGALLPCADQIGCSEGGALADEEVVGLYDSRVAVRSRHGDVLGILPKCRRVGKEALRGEQLGQVCQGKK